MPSLVVLQLKSPLVGDLVAKFVRVPDGVELGKARTGLFEALAHGFAGNAHFHQGLI